MMLVQKPPAFSLAQPSSLPSFHRRHPSAPPQVVVQPTRTPGLLSIARPAKTQSPQRQLPAAQRKGQPTKETTKEKKVARAPPALLNPAEITEKRPAVVALQGPVSPTPVRGRVAPKQGRERRNKQHGRQPSPPVVEDASASTPPSSQAEVLVPSHNPFDPFAASSKPSTPPTSIAAPKPHHPQLLSTSAPTRSSVVRPRTKKSSASKDRFPVCDDMTDAGDISEAETPPPRTPPATPLRKQAHAKTPLFPSPSPQQQRKGDRRKHRRSPSEGVFNMSLSSDEDVAAASETQGNNNALLSFARSRALTRPPVTPPTSLSKASGGAFMGTLGLEKVPAPFFASSKFQNSPSPEDLPAGEPAWE